MFNYKNSAAKSLFWIAIAVLCGFGFGVIYGDSSSKELIRSMASECTEKVISLEKGYSERLSKLAEAHRNSTARTLTKVEKIIEEAHK